MRQESRSKYLIVKIGDFFFAVDGHDSPAGEYSAPSRQPQVSAMAFQDQRGRL
jgi:hypothetical protein